MNKNKFNQNFIIDLLSTKSFTQLDSTFGLYYELSKISIEESLKKYTKGNLLFAFKTISINNHYENH